MRSYLKKNVEDSKRERERDIRLTFHFTPIKQNQSDGNRNDQIIIKKPLQKRNG